MEADKILEDNLEEEARRQQSSPNRLHPVCTRRALLGRHRRGWDARGEGWRLGRQNTTTRPTGVWTRYEWGGTPRPPTVTSGRGSTPTTREAPKGEREDPA